MFALNHVGWMPSSATAQFVRPMQFHSIVAMSVDGPHPLHPHSGRASLVPRLGHGQQRLLSSLTRQGSKITVSPLHFMGHNRELALFASKTLGLVLDPETHLRQLPASHRGDAYRKQLYGGGTAFRPEQDPISSDELIELAQAPIDAQRAYGATLLLTTYHLCGGIGSRGRELDLKLAQAGVEHFAAERIDQPAEHAAVGVSRELYAGIALREGALDSPMGIIGLADAYAELDVSGYWVRIEGFAERASESRLHAAGALLGALSATGRSVVVCGPGALHLALLVADICSSVGLGEAERFAVPDASRPRRSGPRTRNAYHPAFMRSFQVGGRPARAAFASSHCRCRLHRRDSCPEGGTADEHNAIVRVIEEREALEGTAAERREWLRVAALMASRQAEDIGIEIVSYAKLAAVLRGIDAGRDAQSSRAA